MADAILVLNAGSSSLKFSAFAIGPALQPLLHGQIEPIGGAAAFRAVDSDGTTIGQREWTAGESLSHAAATDFLLSWGRSEGLKGHRLAGAGHRVVHGGTRFDGPVRLDAAVLAELQSLVPLAPLHQPHNLAAIAAVTKLAPELPQVACFDTAFHRSQPLEAQSFALPHTLTESGVRRYGFHGLSYEFIADALRTIDPAAAAGRTIVAHLGNGASLCALHAGRSIATTMGFTALDGLVMGTRCGAIDPGVLLYLQQHAGMDVDTLSRLLYEQSGLLGVSGISGDMRTLLASSEPRARQAIDLFVYRLSREIGSLAAALGGLDALVFTGGIGQHAAPIRTEVCRAARWLGIELDESADAQHAMRISTAASRVKTLVIPTNEELMIARHTARVLELSTQQHAAPQRSKESGMSTATKPVTDRTNYVSLADEEAVRQLLSTTVMDLWEVVNNLTRLRPSKRERYRVAIFGSARAKPGTFVYEEVKRVAAALTAMGCDIVTGGGPGLMQAANEGAKSAGLPEQSVGIRVDLPFEQEVNPFVAQAFEHKTFFTRLHHFVLASDAFVVVPGGIGTVLETLMIWQLLQVRHVENVPLILVGKMWAELVEWANKSMLDPRLPLANPEDMHIPRCLDSADEAIAVVRDLHAKWAQAQKSNA